ncbi:hypothetical protein ABEG10_13940 [Burkholderia cenocepacia]|uniref:hypothetical protein n=1 Tax=Burkholderia cenocepacia TaxID=95486 RepID=UPI0020A0FB91|nr:hypothetical protein [Burkholderia cenocepacia]MCO8326818.1 hypothetical protein [Burkholderia cenocepacia]MCO8333881.1 hypothetical protein [Burkholderia cenocepacia]MCO8341254.1 hypothetical protein [Burkholderia cenocepacia]MCO8348674.1 hypothetical protein [Burkholderia cenocepacia]MCO8361866.1 hypothetical protein [Burkholderia cenocepacia]
MLIKLTRDKAVNPAHVVSANIESSHYSDTRLVVEMVTGNVICVTHTPYSLDGVDVYKVYQALLDAKAT